MKFILKLKSILEPLTKETKKALKIMILGFILITAIIIIKYKPVYEVKLNNETIGYVVDKGSFEKIIQEEILNQEGQNVENVSLEKKPTYTLTFLNRKVETDETAILAKLEENKIITYKFYAVALNNETKAFVDTLEEAEKVVEQLKAEYKEADTELELEITLEEKYTQNVAEVKTDTAEKVEKTIEQEINELLEEEEAKKAIATINGINVSALPVSGTISSRFGVRSSIRSGAHTGLDIACEKGTNIKVVADGEIIFAEKNGAYGNLIKVDHGNGVETWYAHCDKILVKVGQKVKSGDVIGKVGSTGNSTGPHLHLEIRIDGTAVNPQKYLYK